jgi:hypothetical protein
MSHFMIGDAVALRRCQNPALLFESGDDAFDRGRHILDSHLHALAARRDDRCLGVVVPCRESLSAVAACRIAGKSSGVISSFGSPRSPDRP